MSGRRSILAIFLVIGFYLAFVSSAQAISSSTTLYFGSQEKVLDEQGNVVEEKNYVGLPYVTAVKTKDGVFYLYQDHLSSTRLVADKSGNRVEEYDYYPYGQLVNSELVNPQPVNPLIDKLYTSQTKDNSTDLYYYHARYYNSATGNFLSADSAEGPNRYAYVNGNPIGMNDPEGTSVNIPIRNLGMTEEELAYEAPERTTFWQNLEAYGISVARSISPWIPNKWEQKLSGREMASLNVNASLMMVGMVSAPAALPGKETVINRLEDLTFRKNHPQFAKVKEGWSSNRVESAWRMVSNEIFESDIGRAIRTEEWDKAIGLMGKAGLKVEKVDPSVLRNLGKAVTNQATVQGNRLLMEESLFTEGGGRLAGELFHEYTAWWAQQRGWGRELPQFSTITRMADVICGLIWNR